MTAGYPLTIDDVNRRIERGQRNALLRTFLLSLAIVAAAALLLAVTLWEIGSATRRLADANQRLAAAQSQLTLVGDQIAAANDAKAKAEAELQKSRAALDAATQQAQTLKDQAASLTAQVGDLTAQLEETRKALAEALDLNKQVYKLDWSELKMMYMTNGPAVDVLEVVNDLKDRTKWSMSNTPDKGYNSPGFAALVLQKLSRLPEGGLAGLPRDNGPPNIGDIVIYEGGYHMFYFRDHEHHDFVVGMTPFGVEALNADFARKVAVLRTHFPPQ